MKAIALILILLQNDFVSATIQYKTIQVRSAIFHLQILDQIVCFDFQTGNTCLYVSTFKIWGHSNWPYPSGEVNRGEEACNNDLGLELATINTQAEHDALVDLARK